MYDDYNNTHNPHAVKIRRRVIGPIPPRDKKGRLLLADDLDREGNVCPRDPRELLAWEFGMKAAPEAIKGLKLFEVDMDREPLVQLYARNQDEALAVYQCEMGITKFGQVEARVKQIG